MENVSYCSEVSDFFFFQEFLSWTVLGFALFASLSFFNFILFSVVIVLDRYTGTEITVGYRQKSTENYI